jgi:hypothetical protein
MKEKQRASTQITAEVLVLDCFLINQIALNKLSDLFTHFIILRFMRREG